MDPVTKGRDVLLPYERPVPFAGLNFLRAWTKAQSHISTAQPSKPEVDLSSSPGLPGALTAASGRRVSTTPWIQRRGTRAHDSTCAGVLPHLFEEGSLSMRYRVYEDEEVNEPESSESIYSSEAAKVKCTLCNW